MRFFVCFLLLVLSTQSLHAQEDPPSLFPPDRDYFLEAAIDNPTPFLGEQITYTLRFYYALSAREPIINLPAFSGFWRSESVQSELVQQIGERQYTVIERNYALEPIQAGDFLFEPAVLVVPNTALRAGETLISQAMSIQVRPLPDGAPEAFDGIVGQYDMTVELMPQVLEPGELATFRITFTGSGNFDQLLPPELPVPGSWRVYGKPPEVIARPFFDEKVFEWTVIPDQSGVHLLSPVIFSYFNPVLLEYQTIESETFSLEVLPRANEAENVAEENAPLIDESLATPAPTPEIILTLKSTEGIVSFGDDRPGASFWFLWLVSPVAVFLSVGWNYRQRQRQRNQIKDRQSQALQRAKSRLQRARSGHSDPYPIVIATVLGYFEDKLASTTGDMTRPQLQAVMIDIGVGDLAQREIMACLELAEQGRFAPSGAVAFGSLLARTLDTLSAVDTGWKS